jgi:hypothetical protein
MWVGMGWYWWETEARDRKKREREDSGAFNSAVHDLLKLTYANILATAVE